MDSYDKLISVTDGLHDAGQTPIYWSPPGMGKSSLIGALAGRPATTTGVGISGAVTVQMAAKTPEDLMGIPRVTPTATLAGEVPATTATMPDWAVKALNTPPDKRFYVVWEEFTRAVPETQVVVQETLLNGVLSNGQHLGGHVRHIIAANPPEEVAGNAYEITDALSSRLTHIDFRPALGAWCDGMRSGFPGEDTAALSAHQRVWRGMIADYLAAHPDQVYQSTEHDRTRGWATYRTWTRLADTLAVFNGQPDTQASVCAPTIGPDAANAFLGWLKKTKTLPPIEDLVAAPSKIRGFNAGQQATLLGAAVNWAGEHDDDDEAWKVVGLLNKAGTHCPAVTRGVVATGLPGLARRLGYRLFADGGLNRGLYVDAFPDLDDDNPYAYFKGAADYQE